MRASEISIGIYVCLNAKFARGIDPRQYRRMPKSLVVVLDPADPVTCCPPLSVPPLSVQPLSVQPLSVPPLSVQPLSQAQAEQVVPLLKALADPVRLRLMSLVASHPGGEACVCDLNVTFDLSQPTISHHLKVLHDAGLLAREKRGVWVYYRARTEALASLGLLIGSPEPPATA
jgi:ArsR family transcriptional regulator, arsenate/arsenite/antimonite-responsive transcriptional repressor